MVPCKPIPFDEQFFLALIRNRAETGFAVIPESDQPTSSTADPLRRELKRSGLSCVPVRGISQRKNGGETVRYALFVLPGSWHPHWDVEPMAPDLFQSELDRLCRLFRLEQRMVFRAGRPVEFLRQTGQTELLPFSDRCYGDLLRLWFSSVMPDDEQYLSMFLNEQPMTISGAHRRTCCGEVVRYGLRPS